jgi:hypothetical protein
MVALLNAVVGALLRTLVDNCLGTGTPLLAHVGQSRQRTHKQQLASVGNRARQRSEKR